MAAFLNIQNKKRNYQDHYKPLEELSDQDLYKSYRFTREGIDFLVDLLDDDLKESETNKGRPISPELMVLVTLK